MTNEHDNPSPPQSELPYCKQDADSDETEATVIGFPLSSEWIQAIRLNQEIESYMHRYFAIVMRLSDKD